MTTYTKTWRNYLWLAWFTLQVPIITCKSSKFTVLSLHLANTK